MSGRRIRFSAFVIGLALASTVHASFINTPPLFDFNDVAHVCRVFNMNAASQVSPIQATVSLIENGVVACSQVLTFTSAGSSGEVECGGGFFRFCRVEVTSNAIADNMVVNLFLEDGTGTAKSLVRGTRIPTLVPSIVAPGGGITTGSLTVSDQQPTNCIWANTSTTDTIPTEGRILSDSGAILASGVVTLNPGGISVITVAAPTPPAGMTCVVLSTTAANAKQLRASLGYNFSGLNGQDGATGNL